MTQITWKESYSIGVDAIDEQHKKLLSLINDLYEAQRSGTTQVIIGDVISKLFDYTVYHFGMEEKMQVDNRYPMYEEHRKEHLGFIEQLEVFKKDANKNNLLLSLKTTDFLKDWTINHILGTDKEFAKYLMKIEGAE